MNWLYNLKKEKIKKCTISQHILPRKPQAMDEDTYIRELNTKRRDRCIETYKTNIYKKTHVNRVNSKNRQDLEEEEQKVSLID